METTIWTTRREANRAARQVKAARADATTYVARVDDWPSYAVAVWCDGDAASLTNDADTSGWLEAHSADAA